MSEGKNVVPKIVMYSVLGRTVPAIVLAGRVEGSHLGSAGEPLLSLAFIDPARETGLSKDQDGNVVYPFGRFPQIFVEHDVVHESHEFTDEFLRDKGVQSDAQILALRGHGEWVEIDLAGPSSDEYISTLRGRAEDAEADADKAEGEAADLRAELAQAKAELATRVAQLDAAVAELAELRAISSAVNVAVAATPAPAPQATTEEAPQS